MTADYTKYRVGNFNLFSNGQDDPILHEPEIMTNNKSHNLSKKFRDRLKNKQDNESVRTV